MYTDVRIIMCASLSVHTYVCEITQVCVCLGLFVLWLALTSNCVRFVRGLCFARVLLSLTLLLFVCLYSLLVRAPDSWSKYCEVESRQERRENCLLHSQLCVLTLIRWPFQPHVTAMARERPRSFCQKCKWQVTPKHSYSLDPTKSEWADYAAVQA